MLNLRGALVVLLFTLGFVTFSAAHAADAFKVNDTRWTSKSASATWNNDVAAAKATLQQGWADLKSKTMVLAFKGMVAYHDFARRNQAAPTPPAEVTYQPQAEAEQPQPVPLCERMEWVELDTFVETLVGPEKVKVNKANWAAFNTCNASQVDKAKLADALDTLYTAAYDHFEAAEAKQAATAVENLRYAYNLNGAD